MSSSVATTPPRRVRTARAALLASCCALLLALGPALVGTLVTGDRQPRAMLAHPQDGWTLLANVLTSTPSAAAPTPGAALHRATVVWPAGDPYEPTRAELVHLVAGRPLQVRLLGGGSAVVSGTGPLVWVIEGRRAGSRAEGAIGAIDYRSGDVRLDARTTTHPSGKADA